jgi:hypothetical protein
VVLIAASYEMALDVLTARHVPVSHEPLPDVACARGFRKLPLPVIAKPVRGAHISAESELYGRHVAGRRGH